MPQALASSANIDNYRQYVGCERACYAIYWVSGVVWREIANIEPWRESRTLS